LFSVTYILGYRSSIKTSDLELIWFLGFLLLVPILVHLFSFRRAKKQYFSTLRFINRVSTDSKSKSRLKHLLILSNRILIFLTILSTFFYYLSRSQSIAGAKSGSYLIDRSNSMYIEKEDIRPIDQVDEYLTNSNLNSKGDRSPNDDILYFNSRYSLLNNLPRYPFLASDFQGISIEDLHDNFVDSTIKRTILYAGEINNYRNVYVDSLSLSFNPDDLSKQRLTLFPGVSEPLWDGTIVFKLFHEGRQLSSIVKDIKEIGQISFDVPIDVKGNLSIRIEGDEVYYDNEFYFVIRDRERPNIAILNPLGSPYINHVFANENLFETYRVNSNSIDFELIRKSDVIVLAGMESLPSGFERQIQDKTVIVFPNPDLTQNDLWSGVQIRNKDTLERFEVDFDFDHPIFSGIFTKKRNEDVSPTSISFFSFEGDYQTIVSFRNRDPFLIKSSGLEHYYFNTSLNLSSSTFVTHSTFLPLLYRMALLTSELDGRIYYYPGDFAYMDVTNNEIPPKISSESIEVIPEFNPSGKGIIFKIPDLGAGFYDVLHDNDTFQLAINIPKEESLMYGVSLEELKENFGDLNHIRIQSIGSSSIEDKVSGYSIWKYALILIILLVITETLLHRYLK